MDLCWQVMSLLLDMLSRLIITFLPKSKRLLISWLQSPSAVILEPPQDKIRHCFPIYFPWSMGLDTMSLVFWMLSFKPPFSLSSFTFIKRLFSSSLFCHKLGVICGSELLIFLPAILSPAYASSSLAFHMMYSAYKLNKQETIYIRDVLLFQFETSLFFHVQF